MRTIFYRSKASQKREIRKTQKFVVITLAIAIVAIFGISILVNDFHGEYIPEAPERVRPELRDEYRRVQDAWIAMGNDDNRNEAEYEKLSAEMERLYAQVEREAEAGIYDWRAALEREALAEEAARTNQPSADAEPNSGPVITYDENGLPVLPPEYHVAGEGPRGRYVNVLSKNTDELTVPVIVSVAFMLLLLFVIMPLRKLAIGLDTGTGWIQLGGRRFNYSEVVRCELTNEGCAFHLKDNAVISVAWADLEQPEEFEALYRGAMGDRIEGTEKV